MAIEWATARTLNIVQFLPHELKCDNPFKYIYPDVECRTEFFFPLLFVHSFYYWTMTAMLKLNVWEKYEKYEKKKSIMKTQFSKWINDVRKHKS